MGAQRTTISRVLDLLIVTYLVEGAEKGGEDFAGALNQVVGREGYFGAGTDLLLVRAVRRRDVARELWLELRLCLRLLQCVQLEGCALRIGAEAHMLHTLLLFLAVASLRP